MGAQTTKQARPLRVVLDTNVVVSALLFRNGRLVELRNAWMTGAVQPLADKETIDELVRVLGYPKFSLERAEIEELLALYLPFAEIVEHSKRANSLPRSRDAADRKFLRLADTGGAEALVTGDKALLDLAGRIRFAIEPPAEFLTRFGL